MRTKWLSLGMVYLLLAVGVFVFIRGMHSSPAKQADSASSFPDYKGISANLSHLGMTMSLESPTPTPIASKQALDDAAYVYANATDGERAKIDKNFNTYGEQDIAVYRLAQMFDANPARRAEIEVWIANDKLDKEKAAQQTQVQYAPMSDSDTNQVRPCIDANTGQVAPCVPLPQ